MAYSCSEKLLQRYVNIAKPLGGRYHIKHRLFISSHLQEGKCCDCKAEGGTVFCFNGKRGKTEAAELTEGRVFELTLTFT